MHRVLPFDNTAGGGAPSTNKLMRKGSTGSGDGTHSGGPPERPLVGRDAEVGFILQRATNMVSGLATGGAIVIEGNTGALACVHEGDVYAGKQGLQVQQDSRMRARTHTHTHTHTHIHTHTNTHTHARTHNHTSTRASTTTWAPPQAWARQSC